ncbi:cobaltochelatase subunit CobN [Paenibacillus senegalensis]|uniref:cobaltochelatase subunit CobN n=1 Tax=Paenibacillus senegalensis TaxID=1465766 RepID=UPI000289BC13|nr:cobaltochelatase subunit CobN [Paenibacillus senegalensis]
MNITVLTGGEAVQAHLAAAYRRFDDHQKQQLKLSIINLGDHLNETRSAELLASAGLILFDAHGVHKERIALIRNMLHAAPSAYIVPVGGNAAEIRDLLKLGVLTASELPDAIGPPAGQAGPPEQRNDYLHYVRIMNYWRGGGEDNMYSLLCLAAREYSSGSSFPVPPEPIYIRELCLFDPITLTAYSSYSDYANSRIVNEDRPAVALFFLGNGNPADLSACLGPLIEKIEEFANVLPIAFPSVMNISKDRLERLLFDHQHVHLLVNFLPFRLGSGPAAFADNSFTQLLQRLQAPVLHPFFLSTMTEEEYRESSKGLAPAQLMVQVVLPEMDGSIETYPIAAMHREGEDPLLQVALYKMVALPGRIERLVQRIRNWLVLQRKANADKKLALIGYNYPPGEANVFGGTFLDTFASLARMLTWLKQEGYDVTEMTAAELQARFVEQGVVNTSQWAGEGANALICHLDPAFFGKLRNKEWGRDAIKRWGEPPGEIMVEDGAFLIPGIINGNVFIGLQPTRGVHENQQSLVHDKSLPPTHQYSAFYEWIHDHWEADAVVHVGTHGTLEFLPGKETGMSGECIPDQFIGDVPHLYYYYVGNPSEAMIAKRRSHAVLVGYQAPPFVEAELYGEWTDLERLLHEFREAEQFDPGRAAELLQKVQECAKSLHVPGNDPDELEEELYRMKRSLIPGGLHVLGEALSHEDAAQHMRHVLRHERGNIRSLHGLLAEHHGMREELGTNNGNNSRILANLDHEAEMLINDYLRTKSIPDKYQQESPAWQSELIRALNYGLEVYQSVTDNYERTGFMQALEGKYVPAGLAGDVLRSPEVLPSGRNLYAFDPRSVPSPTAMERGARVAELSIDHYRKQHGKYPDTTAVVLWGLETSRTQGETIGQILHYLGVRTGERKGSFRSDYEIIPLRELGRPRLNVVVHITGIFRDMFPNLLDELNQLFRKVSELDEPDEQNRFRAHTRKVSEWLHSDGYDSELIADLASARFFGPAEGQYGTTVTKLIETKNWQEEGELARAYAESQHHLYSLSGQRRAEPKLFRSHLQAVDIVSQIRSSHEYEVTDSDHYYEYFGGLSKSVELAKGSPADSYITDTTGEQIKQESAEHAIARGVRTRLTNPKWIDALLQHPFHGTQTIARRFEYVLGLAATTGKVEPWVFGELHEVYVEDERRSRQMKENNRWAYHAMIESLLESYQRGYWQPGEDALNKLRQRMLELEGDLEGDLIEES